MALTPHTVLYHVPKVEYKKLCVEGENDAGRAGTMPPHCKEWKMTGDAVQMRAEAMNALAHPPLAVWRNFQRMSFKTA